MNLKQVLTFVAQSIIVGLAAAAVILLLMPGSSLFNSTMRADSYHTAIEAAAPAVVNVYSGNTYLEANNPILQDPLFRRFFGEPSQNTKKRIDSRGSGVIMDTEGHILTNAHVIQGAEEIFVTLRDGRETTARTIGIDSDTDLAVLQIGLENLPVIPIGDSSQLRVGDIVLAIGNPYDFGQTVTQGIVSATGRKRLGITTFDNFIQTDADINPGNSGGALISTSGDLVGINTAIYSTTGGSQGIGLATPINAGIEVMRQLISNGRVVRGWIGIQAQPLPSDIAEAMGLMKGGVLVSAVLQGGPADIAGIYPGDVVTKIQGQEIIDPRQAIDTIAKLAPGSKIGMTIVRGWEEIKINVTILQRPHIKRG
ncbi:MAG: trypsin-like peptidase domain-containing protein [Proteobacteria bacterium]|nr:trypsin-like peptidase domain-containing protein [Pseudomonadota bacterium]